MLPSRLLTLVVVGRRRGLLAPLILRRKAIAHGIEMTEPADDSQKGSLSSDKFEDISTGKNLKIL